MRVPSPLKAANCCMIFFGVVEVAFDFQKRGMLNRKPTESLHSNQSYQLVSVHCVQCQGY